MITSYGTHHPGLYKNQQRVEFEIYPECQCSFCLALEHITQSREPCLQRT